MFKELFVTLAVLTAPIPTTSYAQAPTCVGVVQNHTDAAALGAKLEVSLSGEKLYIFWDYIAKKFEADRVGLAQIDLVEFYLLADGNILVIMYTEGCTVNGFTMPYDAFVQQQEEAFGQEV